MGRREGSLRMLSMGLLCLVLVMGRSTPVAGFDLFKGIFGGLEPMEDDSEHMDNMDGGMMDGGGFKKELSASAAGAGSASLSLDKAKGIGAGGSLSGSVAFGKQDGTSDDPPMMDSMAPPPMMDNGMPPPPMMDRGMSPPPMHRGPPPQPMYRGPPPPPNNNYVRAPQPGWGPPPPPPMYAPHPNTIHRVPNPRFNRPY